MTAVKQTIGVIGSLGDLGSQLVRRAKKYGFLVREFDIADRHINTEELSDCEIIHVCAPLENFTLLPVRGMIILHDSVMDASRRFNDQLDQKAAVVHLLMNSAQRAVVAGDQPNAKAAASDAVGRNAGRNLTFPHAHLDASHPTGNLAQSSTARTY